MRTRGPYTLTLLLSLAAIPAAAQTVQNNLWVTNGVVNATAISGNKVYLGGTFTRLGPPTGGFAAIDWTTGALLSPAAGVAGSVRCTIPDGTGGRFVAGDFNYVQGVPHGHLIHLDSTGNVVPWVLGAFDNSIYALAIDPFNPGVLYVGGFFTSVGGATRHRLAAVDIATGTLLDWTADCIGLVYTMAARNGVIYIGGNISQVAGQPRLDLAALDATGALTSWNPGTNGVVYTLALTTAPISHAVTIWVGGQFTVLAGQPRYSLGSVDAGGTATDWSPNSDHAVNAIAFSFFRNFVSAVYAGGTFDQIGGRSINYLAKLDPATGAADMTFAPSPDQPVNALWLDGGSLYAGGEFKNIGGASRQYLASLDATSGAASGWDPSPNAPVLCVDVTDGAVHAGGQFGSLGGVYRNHLAALDVTSGMPTSWDPNVDGAVTALTVNNGVLYAGGQFIHVGGVGRGHGAAFDGAGTLLTWDPKADNEIDAFLPFGNALYAGGAFLNIGGQGQRSLAQLDLTSGDAGAILPQPDGPVFALATYDSTMYVGGRFQYMQNQPHRCAAAFDLKSHAVLFWNPDLDGACELITTVYAIAVTGSTITIGGDFIEANFAQHVGIVRVDRIVGVPSSWAPPIFAAVRALLPMGNTLFIGGDFVSFNPAFTGSVAAVDIPSFSNWAWSSQVFGNVCALAAGAGSLYVGGAEVAAGGWPHQSFAAFHGGVTGVEDAPVMPEIGVLRLSANPSRGAVSLGFTLPRRTAIDAAIYDAAGRRVRHIDAGTRPAGEQWLEWDGRDDFGKPAPAGVYFARVRADGNALGAKLVRLE